MKNISKVEIDEIIKNHKQMKKQHEKYIKNKKVPFILPNGMITYDINEVKK